MNTFKVVIRDFIVILMILTGLLFALDFADNKTAVDCSQQQYIC